MTDDIAFQDNGPSGISELALVNVRSQAVLLEDLAVRMKAGRGFTVATLNLDHIVKMRAAPDFRAAYQRHSHVVADGNPIVWLSRLAGRAVDLVPGSELITPLVALAADIGVPVALLGATQATLDAAATRLQAAHPGLQIVARIAPPFGFEPQSPAADACLEQVAQSGAGLCFLALGAPKQERLAVRGAERLPHCGFISIGAGLDFIAGYQARAPQWVRKLAMEWVWRMFLSPKRLAGRYLACIMILPALTVGAMRMQKQEARR